MALARADRPATIPLWLKILFTLHVIVLIPVYWIHYGPQNFLWFSDIALFVTCAALWLESRLLASMTMLAVGLIEVVWNIAFFGGLFFGLSIGKMADYMFDAQWQMYLRALSLFHVYLPPLLVWMIWKLGYDRRAVLCQTLLTLIILPLSYALGTPDQNINWSYGMGGPQFRVAPLAYLGILMILFPLVIYLPTHILMIWLFRSHITTASAGLRPSSAGQTDR